MRSWHAALLAPLLLCGISVRAEAKKAPPPMQIVAAPPFTLPTLHGDVSSDSLRGKVVVLDFWASWCGPCRGSFPWLGSIQKRFGDSGVVVVAVNLDKSRDDADVFLAKYPAPFIVAFDPEGKTPEAYRVTAMPTTFVIGRDGTILHRHAGFESKKTGAIEKIIHEASEK